MKYKSGFLRSLLGVSWTVETKQDHILYKSANQSGMIYYYDIQKVIRHPGVIADKVSISVKNAPISITNFSEVDSRNLCLDIEDRIKKSVISALSGHFDALQSVSVQINEFLNGNRYIAQSNIREWLKSFPNIGSHLSHPYFEISYLPKEIGRNLSLLADIQSSKSEKLKQRNFEFVQCEMVKYKKLFDSLEKYPLTDEQMQAAIIDEDRNLLIAAAGSGKSATIVAKVAYLIESGLAKPDEILVLAYNKDAQIEIEQRLKSAMKKITKPTAEVKAKTFHSYGLEVIAEATGQKPNIAKIAVASKSVLTSMFSELIKDLASKNSFFSETWVNYLTTAKHYLPPTDTITTRSEYDNFLKQMGAQWRGPNNNRSLKLITINNKEVKSLEELRIFNWLVINGVNFEYERPYEIATTDAKHGQYHPDFFYPDANVYHEHFALDEAGEAPTFMKGYLEGVYWKRNLHKEHNTKLIETLSADFRGGNILSKLKEKLETYGVKFVPVRNHEIDELVRKSFDQSRDIDIFVTILKHVKANNFTIEELRTKFKGSSDQYRADIFIQLFTTIYEEYERRLSDFGEIDFEDQINQASDHLLNKDVVHSWKYVLVDEFQDISQDRKKLVLSVLSQDQYMKLFAVGDDWQSIYRFAGADIDIMTNFENHFGSTAQNNLTNTFRSYQGLVNVASTFVQKNSNQLKKIVTAQAEINADQVVIKSYLDDGDQIKKLWGLLTSIQKKSIAKRAALSVFILARYNHDLPDNRAEIIDHFNLLDINFKSIHASKGLEADYVILLNLNSGTYGFPSLIADDPLIRMVLPKTEDFPHAEERRLFYVALTRAKRAIFLMNRKDSVSKFVIELVNIPKVSAPKEMQLAAALNSEKNNEFLRHSNCPKCKNGMLKIKTDRAGLYDPFLGCSDYPKCKHSQKPVRCPKCQSGDVVRRANKKTNEPFYTCNKFECDYKFRKKITKKKF